MLSWDLGRSAGQSYQAFLTEAKSSNGPERPRGATRCMITPVELLNLGRDVPYIASRLRPEPTTRWSSITCQKLLTAGPKAETTHQAASVRCQPAKCHFELLRKFVLGKSCQDEANSGNEPEKKKGSSGFGVRP